jgi:hypothetical protein
LSLETRFLKETASSAVELCQAGIRAEFEGKIDAARSLFQQAWEAVTDDYEACIAAHYVARHAQSPQEALHWNQVALARADAVGGDAVGGADRVQSFYPSLYVNLGHAHEVLGHQAEAQHFYQLAAELGLVHQAGQE